MELTHHFQVPASVEETWACFNDLVEVAQCFPGAEVTEHDGDSFAGTVKVKLGPIALVYLGSGTFVERDQAPGRMVIEAKGKDKRGNGTAGAAVTLTMAAADAGTDVKVVTDLSITGKPAQFGRGVMQDVSDKLLGQFTQCLAQKLAVAHAVAEPSESPAAPVADAPVAAAVVPESTAAPTPPVHQESIDLGATVMPALAKAYWKPAVGVAAAIGLIIWWLGSR